MGGRKEAIEDRTFEGGYLIAPAAKIDDGRGEISDVA